jgi:HSP20 family protein
MATETAEKVEREEKPKEIKKRASVLRPLEEMERVFEGIVPRRWPFEWERPLWRDLAARFEGKLPRIDVIDREDEVVVRAELSGVEKNDLDVSISDSTVTIKGVTKREEKEEKGDYYRCEITQGEFARTVTLPAAVNGARAKAKFKNGLLELTLPKAEKSKRHSVEIET